MEYKSNLSRNSNYELILNVWQSGQNVSGNSSSVRRTLVIRKKSGSGYYSGYTSSWFVNVNGNTKSGSFKYAFNTTASYTLLDDTITVPHNSNGSKSISVSASFTDGASQIGNATVSGTLGLTTIPRRTTFTNPTSFTLGQTFVVTANRSSTTFEHAVEIRNEGTVLVGSPYIEGNFTADISPTQLQSLVGKQGSVTLDIAVATREKGTQAFIGWEFGTISCNLNMPRTTFTTPNTFTLGNDFVVSVSKSSGIFDHAIEVRYNGEVMVGSPYIDGNFTATVPRVTLLNATGSYNTVTLDITLFTRVKSTGQAYSTTKGTITCNLNAPNPTISSISDIETASYMTGYSQYVQSWSRLKLGIVGASGGQGATIRSHRIEFAGYASSTSSLTTGAINSNGEITATATVTDTRGKSTSITKKLTVLEYFSPKIISASVHRSNSNGTRNDSGTYIKMTMEYSIAPLWNMNVKNHNFIAGSNNSNDSLPTYSGTASKVIAGFPVDQTHYVEFKLSDGFTTTIAPGRVPTGSTTMHWGRDWVGVGSRVPLDKQRSGVGYFGGDIYKNNGTQVMGRRMLEGFLPPDRIVQFESTGWLSPIVSAVAYEDGNNRYNEATDINYSSNGRTVRIFFGNSTAGRAYRIYEGS